MRTIAPSEHYMQETYRKELIGVPVGSWVGDLRGVAFPAPAPASAGRANPQLLSPRYGSPAVGCQASISTIRSLRQISPRSPHRRSAGQRLPSRSRMPGQSPGRRT